MYTVAVNFIYTRLRLLPWNIICMVYQKKDFPIRCMSSILPVPVRSAIWQVPYYFIKQKK